MTHHAILVQHSDPQSVDVETAVSESLQDQYFEKLTIDDVRALTESAHRRPPQGVEKLCFIVRTAFITVEAQHALLKLLEEPPVTSRFVFVLPQSLSLLPTVLSRFHVAELIQNDEVPEEFSEFFSKSVRERLELIESELKAKNVVWQERIKQGLIVFLKKEKITVSTILVDLEFVASNLLTRGASNKMLLEQLALTLPLKGN